MSQGPRRIKTAGTVVGIIEFLHEEGRADLTEIAAHIDLAKSTTHSYLETLRAHELVIKTDSEYRLGLKFLDLGGLVRNRTNFYEAAKSELWNIYAETGHTVQLATEEYDDLVLLERINPDETVGFGAHVGRRGHFHTAALGKAILAYLPEEEVESILAKHELVSLTQHSITERDELDDELEAIREQGYAVNDEEEHHNYKGVARPIKAGERVEGAISIAGPKTELEMSEESYHDLLRSATDKIEIALEYD